MTKIRRSLKLWHNKNEKCPTKCCFVKSLIFPTLFKPSGSNCFELWYIILINVFTVTTNVPVAVFFHFHSDYSKSNL